MTEILNSISKLTTREETVEVVEKTSRGKINDLTIIQLGGGALQFAEAAFDGISSQIILAKKVTRESQGRGPHFDAYRGLLSEQYPYLAQFNLSGEARIETTHLQSELASAYWRQFPEHSNDAYTARRHLGFTALLAAGDEKTVGTLEPGTGFILPQNHDVPIVHNVIPSDPEQPGQFIKLLIPNDTPEARKFMEDDGYMSLDSVMTQALAKATVEPVKIVRVPGPTRTRTVRVEPRRAD